jgi:signal transduction histidine kinase
MSPERIAILELVASRVAHILRISRRLESERLAERRRQRQRAIEREQLTREVEDGVGRALSGLLQQIRAAMAGGQAGPRDLKVLEEAACQAVDGARTLAFGIRHLEHGVASLEEARSYAQTMLRSIHCRLNWTEERPDPRIASRAVRELVQAITESIDHVVLEAKAKLVRVRVDYPDGRIRVTIRENGAALTRRPARWESPERLARVGGTFEVRPTPNGSGSLILIEARRT